MGEFEGFCDEFGGNYYFLYSLRFQLGKHKAEENLLLTKWNDKSQSIGDWLDDMEDKMSLLSKQPVDEPAAIATFNEGLEVNNNSVLCVNKCYCYLSLLYLHFSALIQ